MSFNDILADSLIRIKNAQMRRKPFAVLRSSNLVLNVLAVLKREGYITGFEEFEQSNHSKVVKVDLKYTEDGESVISDVKRVSKAGRRVYSGVKDLRKSMNGLGVLLLSTPKGVLSDAEARAEHVGGEILCEIN